MKKSPPSKAHAVRLLPRIFTGLVAAAAMFGASIAPAATIHVFLVGGQSNADGRADVTGLPTNLANPQADVPYYWAIDSGSPSSNWGVPTSVGTLETLRPGRSRTSQLGPEVTFGRSMADYYATVGQSIAIIKFAGGGTDLDERWVAGGNATTTGDGNVYTNFQTIVGNGMSALQAANPTATLMINGLIWMQGESDADTTAESTAYQTNLTNFIRDIRLTYGANLPFIIGQLSSAQTGTGGATDRNNVRTAQAAVDAADPFAKLVVTDSFGLNGDSLHFSTAGQQALGSAFATQMQSLVPLPEPTALPLMLLGCSALLGCRFRRQRRAD